MTQYGFYLDTTRCTGCKTCEIACKDYKDLAVDIAYRKVYDYEGGTVDMFDDGTVENNTFMYHVSLACQHCNHPACVHVCPTGAMHKDDTYGIVSVDATKCVGCGYCHMACPYNVPKVDKTLGHSVKCNGCQERLEVGEQTICVESCPLRALDFGRIEDMQEKYEGEAAIAPMPNPSYTDPNIVIKPCPSARAAGDKEGFVANPMEVV